jgi:hypothetical protein
MNRHKESPVSALTDPGQTILLQETYYPNGNADSRQYLDEYLTALSHQKLETELPPELPARTHTLDRIYESQLTWWTRGWNAKTKADWERIRYLENECDRLYGIAARGGFGVPIIRKHGKSFAELEAHRNAGM